MFRKRKGGGEDELEDDLERFGLVIEGNADEEPDEAFEVWSENKQALELFMVVSGQWNVAVGFGVFQYIDLSYQAVESAMKMLNVKKAARPELFRDIRVMAAAAKEVLNKKRDE